MKCFILTAQLLFAASAAFAQPSLYNKCKGLRVQPVPNGAGVYFSEDCKSAYVLPPNRGNLEITAMTVTENLGLCPAVEASVKIIARQFAELERLSRELSGEDHGHGSESDLFPPKRGPRKDAKQLADAIREAQEIAASLEKSLETYSGIEGSRAQAVLGAEHQHLTEKYQTANPKLQMMPIPIASSEIRFSRQVSTSDVLLPVLLGFSAPGKPVVNGEPGSDGAALFGGIASGQVVLSLAGACPFYDKDGRRMKVEKLNAKSLSPYFNAKVDYTYHLAVHRAYQASFDARGFFKQLQESESSGGFFSTKTVNRLIVERDSQGWFEFKSLSEDPHWEFEENLRQTVKAEMIDRVFKQIFMLTSGGPVAAPALTQPGANGAEVGAENLRKCPYVYCQIGAAVLDVANAIWGNKRSLAEFLSTYHGRETEVVDEAKMLPFQGATVFVE